MTSLHHMTSFMSTSLIDRYLIKVLPCLISQVEIVCQCRTLQHSQRIQCTLHRPHMPYRTQQSRLHHTTVSPPEGSCFLFVTSELCLPTSVTLKVNAHCRKSTHLYVRRQSCLMANMGLRKSSVVISCQLMGFFYFQHFFKS